MTEWQPTPELRFVRRNRGLSKADYAKINILQQKWTRTYTVWAETLGAPQEDTQMDIEWRDVPLSEEDDD